MTIPSTLCKGLHCRMHVNYHEIFRDILYLCLVLTIKDSWLSRWRALNLTRLSKLFVNAPGENLDLNSEAVTLSSVQISQLYPTARTCLHFLNRKTHCMFLYRIVYIYLILFYCRCSRWHFLAPFQITLQHQKRQQSKYVHVWDSYTTACLT